MAITERQIAEALYETLEGKSEKEQKELFPKIVVFLSKRRLLAKSKNILNKLEKLINGKEGVGSAIVTSATKIKPHEESELKQILEKRYRFKKVNLEERLDEKVLGGFRVEVNDEVVDLTIKNKINQLKEFLITN
jgi:F-type H+-transporting ATPase subunit delta